MRQRSMMASATLLLAFGFAAGCGGNPDNDPPDSAAETVDPIVLNQPGDTLVPSDPMLPSDTPTVGAAPGQPAAGGTPPAGQTPAAGGAADPQLVATGRELFHGAGVCAACHGQNGVGTAMAPNLTDGQWIWVTDTQNPREQLATIIRTGVTTPRQHPAPMPPAGGGTMNDNQINALVAYVMSLNR